VGRRVPRSGSDTSPFESQALSPWLGNHERSWCSCIAARGSTRLGGTLLPPARLRTRWLTPSSTETARFTDPPSQPHDTRSQPKKQPASEGPDAGCVCVCFVRASVGRRGEIRQAQAKRWVFARAGEQLGMGALRRDRARRTKTRAMLSCIGAGPSRQLSRASLERGSFSQTGIVAEEPAFGALVLRTCFLASQVTNM